MKMISSYEQNMQRSQTIRLQKGMLMLIWRGPSWQFKHLFYVFFLLWGFFSIQQSWIFPGKMTLAETTKPILKSRILVLWGRTEFSLMEVVWLLVYLEGNVRKGSIIIVSSQPPTPTTPHARKSESRWEMDHVGINKQEVQNIYHVNKRSVSPPDSPTGSYLMWHRVTPGTASPWDTVSIYRPQLSKNKGPLTQQAGFPFYHNLGTPIEKPDLINPSKKLLLYIRIHLYCICKYAFTIPA